MKIVHTADWHIGKTLRGRHRNDEYREVLDELKEFIESEEIDILIVAGDIFDSYSPSAEAENIAYNFFHHISQLNVKTVVIAGNHDSSLRFEALANIMALANVTMLGIFDPAQEDKYRVTLTSRDGSEKAQFFLLPFLFERYFTRAEDLAEKEVQETTSFYSKGVGEILQQFSNQVQTDAYNIVVSHLLIHGAKPGGGERRLYLGDNYAVHPRNIPGNFDYLALGHIHRYQQIEGPCPIYYCGSPLQMDFGEASELKGFLFLEAQAGQECYPKFIAFQKGKKLIELKGTIEEIRTFFEKEPNPDQSYYKITVLTDSTTLGVSHEIKKKCPNAIDIRREYTGTSEDITVPQRVEWLPELYEKFHQQHYDRPPTKEILSEFQEIYLKCIQEKE